jgi:Cytochrome c7 and related cytochrome c
MIVLARLATVALIAFFTATDVLLAQQSRCADCHFANPSAAFAARLRGAETHLRNWDLSAHARANIGCERCHGGDPTTFEPLAAHRGMLPWTNPASPVHRVNLPKTCGVCHAGPFGAFQKSRHFALLQGSNPVVPTCTTCHGDAGENRPSPKALERECATCHRPGRADEHPEHPALGRKMLEGVREVRALLKEANNLIERIEDRPRRARLEQAAQQVDVPLTQATQASHAFVYDDLEERLDTARRRLAALFEELANPGRP